MAGGGFAVANGPSVDYGGRVTFSVVVTCLMAASGGLIFGYDIGISGAPPRPRPRPRVRVGALFIMDEPHGARSLLAASLFFLAASSSGAPVA